MAELLGTSAFTLRGSPARVVLRTVMTSYTEHVPGLRDLGRLDRRAERALVRSVCRDELLRVYRSARARGVPGVTALVLAWASSRPLKVGRHG